MAQSIYNYAYVGFLDQFQEPLGWKRINKDVSSYYFQATRLITFVFDKLIRYFSHQYIAERSVSDTEESLNNRGYIASVTMGFINYLRTLKTSKDNWISTCAVFLELAHDCFEFVTTYMMGNSICIESGYQN